MSVLSIFMSIIRGKAKIMSHLCLSVLRIQFSNDKGPFGFFFLRMKKKLTLDRHKQQKCREGRKDRGLKAALTLGGSGEACRRPCT